jgi:hypothetical protein
LDNRPELGRRERLCRRGRLRLPVDSIACERIDRQQAALDRVAQDHFQRGQPDDQGAISQMRPPIRDEPLDR